MHFDRRSTSATYPQWRAGYLQRHNRCSVAARKKVNSRKNQEIQMASFIPGIAGHGVREKKLKKLIKVSIVDDNEYDGLSLKRILEQSVGFTCVSLHLSAVEAIDQIPKVNPHLAFLDVKMPGMNGLECTRRLKILMPQLKIIIVTGLLDVETMNESLRAGADNFLTKPVVVEQCIAMLLHTASNGVPATEKLAEPRRSGIGIDAPKTGSPLSNRENEVMTLLAKGFLDKEIADQLGLSFSTVHFHVRNICVKLHAGNRTEAVVKWGGTD